MLWLSILLLLGGHKGLHTKRWERTRNWRNGTDSVHNNNENKQIEKWKVLGEIEEKSHLTHFAKLLTHSHSSSLFLKNVKNKLRTVPHTHVHRKYTLHSLLFQGGEKFQKWKRKALEVSLQKINSWRKIWSSQLLRKTWPVLGFYNISPIYYLYNLLVHVHVFFFFHDI